MNEILTWHKKQYPLMNSQDIYKLLFQSEFAGGHMIKNETDCFNYLLNEVSTLKSNHYQDLYEFISEDYLRVNLLPFISFNLDLSYLCQAFINSSNQNNGNLNHFKNILLQNNIETQDYEAHHHSLIYKNAYHPSYRVISKDFLTNQMRILQITNFIKHKAYDNLTIFALEGKCASGKTTLCKNLINELDVTIIPIDDFFKPKDDTLPCSNTNYESIDYYRLRDVITKIRTTKQVKYQRYDCHENKFFECNLPYNNIIILEGVYSFHPYFRDLIDYLIYYFVDQKTQFTRIKERKLYNKFINEWIPQENNYYEKEKILASADIII